jgi:hypothetical protein
MFPIEPHAPKRERLKPVSLEGVSSILGLPLFNNGKVEDIPVEVVVSAYAAIAQLVCCLSEALNVPVPNPLYPFDTAEAALIAHHSDQT